MNLNLPIFTSLLALIMAGHQLISPKEETSVATMAFYNVENLFDTVDDTLTRDDDYTPQGKLRYTEEDYNRKLKNIARVLAGIGRPGDPDGPELIGLAEVENRQVLDDLCKEAAIEKMDLQVIHEDSEDHRGIDVALIYKDADFLPLSYTYHPVRLWDHKGRSIKTRDVLHVHGILFGEEVHLIVNHWPSRRGGAVNSSPRREKAAYVNRQIIEGIIRENEKARIVVMGDFNDDPTDKSIYQVLKGNEQENSWESGLVNPMETMYARGWNSMVYRDRLHLFDQILLSRSLLKSTDSDWTFHRIGIFKPAFLTSSKGRYQGYPRRSFSNGKFNGGFSDHFPVYLQLRRK
jgi:endonuclease/exonuclease/phosphatase family metal-dependent hydrolase